MKLRKEKFGQTEHQFKMSSDISEGNNNKQQRVVNPKFQELESKIYAFIEAVREGNCDKSTR